jgi:methionyl-tRNA formyltransferase
MNVLYLTNPNVADLDLIPPFIESFGDRVIIRTARFDIDYLKANAIEFIVSDRTQFLIKQEIITYLPQRIVNLHPSFLPWGRGYHPNYWSIKKDFPHGVSLHFINDGIDTGDIIAQTRCFYCSDDTLRITYERLRRLMVDLFKTCWPELREGRLSGQPQNLAAGNLHYRRDFDGHFERLPLGWDTRVQDVQAIP